MFNKRIFLLAVYLLAISKAWNMDLESFKALCCDKQFLVLYSTGVFLSQRKEDGYMIRLFSLNDFYAEVYTLQSSGRIMLIKAFTDPSFLAPYLEKIDISALISETGI